MISHGPKKNSGQNYDTNIKEKTFGCTQFSGFGSLYYKFNPSISIYTVHVAHLVRKNNSNQVAPQALRSFFNKKMMNVVHRLTNTIYIV
jgi:succinate-acetate transporter protein